VEARLAKRDIDEVLGRVGPYEPGGEFGAEVA
jgi:hypothetical protein